MLVLLSTIWHSGCLNSSSQSSVACSQLIQNALEEHSILDLATFSVIVHLRAWVTAPLAIKQLSTN